MKRETAMQVLRDAAVLLVLALALLSVRFDAPAAQASGGAARALAGTPALESTPAQHDATVPAWVALVEPDVPETGEGCRLEATPEPAEPSADPEEAEPAPETLRVLKVRVIETCWRT